MSKTTADPAALALDQDPSAQPARPKGIRHYTADEIERIAARFTLPRPIRVADFPQRGNINMHTYLVTAGEGESGREFLLQRINHDVFTRPRCTMAAMIACIQAQKRAIAQGELSSADDWQPIDLVQTETGDLYLHLQDESGDTFWRLMRRIENCKTYKSLGEITDETERLAVAEEVGRGLALYSRLTTTVDTSLLENPLPGYRDTRLYYSQLHAVLAGCRTPRQAADYLPFDPVIRHSTEQHFYIHLSEEEFRARLHDPQLRPFIELALHNEGYGLSLSREREIGRIRTTAIHGDTKIENFLFCAATRRVKALVDLDTIMPHTWLSDWGDMVRSLANVAGEKATDLSSVRVNQEIYEAVARGFLRNVGELPRAEIDRMADAVEIIALELGVRFLADYLRGDSYFQLGTTDPPDLNKTRAMVQLTLFQQLRANEKWARERIAAYAPEPAAEQPRFRRVDASSLLLLFQGAS